MTPASRRRSPGAQPGNPQLQAKRGNLNALKHGFYSRRFTDLERLDLESLLTTGLDSEIAMLRVVTRRVFDLTEGVDNLGQLSDLLGILSMAAGKLSGLLRVQALLGGKQADETFEIVTREIAEYPKELRPRWKS